MSRMILRSAAIAAITICSIVFSASAQQQKKMAIGVHLNYGSSTTIGGGGKLQCRISDPIRVGASATYFYGKKEYTTLRGRDLSLDAHYLFSVANFKWNKGKVMTNPGYIYPLIGLASYKVTASTEFFGVTDELTETKIGLNIGGGCETYFNDRFSHFMELKVGLGKELRRLNARWGIAYHF